jgi:hypothetical protein
MGMVKRLVALLFIFVIAGQVSAGVCGCMGLGNKPKHSCCKRSKDKANAFKAKGCCGANCMVGRTERPAQDRTASSPEIKFQEVRDFVPVIPIVLKPVTRHATHTPAPFANHRLKHPRPPDLFLLHHAFLI